MTKKIQSNNLTKTIKTNFTSEIDQLFHDFDRQRTIFPESRLEEIKKHQIIATKRDES